MEVLRILLAIDQNATKVLNDVGMNDGVSRSNIVCKCLLLVEKVAVHADKQQTVHRYAILF